MTLKGSRVQVTEEEVTVDVIKIARDLEVEPKDVSLLQQSHDKTFTDEVLLLVGEQ